MRSVLILSAVYLGLAAPVQHAAAAETSPEPAAVAAQANRDSGVTVTVTPVDMTAGAASWEFKVVLDTHSQELSDDLQRTAVLVASDGRQQQPTAWDGAPPGGHHREGVLRFVAIAPAPDTIELRIQRPNETAARTFRWQLR